MYAGDWTGHEAVLLQKAMRLSQRDFARKLGVQAVTVARWHRFGARRQLRSDSQQILDAAVELVTDEERRRFETLLRTEPRATLPQSPTLGEFAAPASAPILKGDMFVRHITPSDEAHLEITDMNRRELLLLLSVAATVHAARIDWDQLVRADVGDRVDAGVISQYAQVNQALWDTYSTETSKATVFPAVLEHVKVLVQTARHPGTDLVDRQVRELVSDVLQLAGEVLFDADLYADAAQCYTLAAEFAADAKAHDLWACALTRHAYLGIYDQRCDQVLPLLQDAGAIAGQGDSALSTRYWVQTVHAHALAGIGDASGCARAFDAARGVYDLSSGRSVKWLRFDGTRIDEDQASCHVRLGNAEAAESILEPMMQRPLSQRRRASVLVDMAAAGALRRDPVQAVMYGSAALDIARQTHSGYVGRRLNQLGPQLSRMRGDRHVERLATDIVALTAASA
ncbi:helix-turn-helix domain-containing protein [Nocardia sp. IFM 10818]